MTTKLLLFSGGLDSVVLAKKYSQQGCKLECLFIDRGQSNLLREKEAVAFFTSEIGLEVYESSLKDWSLSWKNICKVQDKEIPRNAIFVLAAIPFAHMIEADDILLGCNLDDTSVPDGSEGFIDSMNSLLEATKQPFVLKAPFLDKRMQKVDVAQAAVDLFPKSVIDRSWSCWGGGEKPCGNCGACRSRDAAFKRVL